MPDSDLVGKSVKAIGYRVGGGGTSVDLNGTDLMAQAIGEVKVEAKTNVTYIKVSLKNMTDPSKLGAEFLTYVLWVVTPDGRTGNTGELPINKNGEAKLNATTPAQTFAMDHYSGAIFCRACSQRDGGPGKRHPEKYEETDLSS